MANVSYLLLLLASLAVWQTGAEDACDSVECLPSSASVCAMDQETGEAALFADECVLQCASCRLATGFKKVNSSLCSTGARNITACPNFDLSQDNEEAKAEGPDAGVAVLQIDIGGDGSDGLPPLFEESGPLPLPSSLLSVGSELLRRLVMSSQPEQPPPAPEGLTIITADVKMDVVVNMPPLAPPPPPPHLMELPEQLEQSGVYSAASPTALASLAAAFAFLVAMTVAAIHIHI